MVKKSKDEREHPSAETAPDDPEAAAVGSASADTPIPGPAPEEATAQASDQAPPPDGAQQKADELAVLGKMTPRERAFFAFGLEERHVLASKEYPQPDGTVDVAILTQGGQRLRWPRDQGRVLSDMEKGDAVAQPVPGGIFPQR